MIPGREWERDVMSRKKDNSCLSAVEVKIREWYFKEKKKAEESPSHVTVWLSKGIGMERGIAIAEDIEKRGNK
jgi:hypothetical protein